MKNKSPQNYQDLCSYAFKLFSLGLTNKQMADTEPQIKYILAHLGNIGYANY